MLIGAAADRWNVEPAECETADGFVINGARTFTFGELAEEEAGRRPPRNAPLQTSTKQRLIGERLQRLDGPAKAKGSWRFSGDVRLPGMLYASARMAPPGGQLQTFSRDAIRRAPGVRHLSATRDWIAIVADNWWQAEEALKASDPRFSGGRTPVEMRPLFENSLANFASRQLFSSGNYEEATRGSRPLTATYYAAPSQHLQLEPLTATARVNEGGVELWVATQAPQFGHGTDALYPMPPGGPAGRAIEPDAAPIAIALARAAQRPVQLVLSQSASQNHDRVSAGALARLAALPGNGGITVALSMQIATAGGLESAIGRLEGRQGSAPLRSLTPDFSILPYSIPNIRIDAADPKIPYTPGYMRGSPQREFTFFTESFIDELAHAAGLEPLAFRMSMLGGNVRLARCLEAAAQLAGWDGGASGSTMGLAGASAFGSHIGLVATASIGDAQRVKVHRLVAAVDCGRPINTGLVEQQIEAGLIWSLAQATSAGPEWIAGMPRARPFGGIDLPRLGDAPEVVVHVLPSTDEPGGVSGLGTLPLAPAVANAVHAGSGKRMRTLPFDVRAT
jgi:isoquinoline 1-oxidoreductase beta subunit